MKLTQMTTFSYTRRWVCGPLQPGYHVWSDGRLTVVLDDGNQCSFSTAQLERMRAEAEKEKAVETAIARRIKKEISTRGLVNYY